MEITGGKYYRSPFLASQFSATLAQISYPTVEKIGFIDKTIPIYRAQQTL
jgi:hypothetical protein